MSRIQSHVAEKSATYEILKELERSAPWPRVPLTEAVDLNPKPDRSSLSDELEVSFVPMAAVEAATGAIDASTVRRYGEVKKGYTYFRDGDVLFAKITPCMENGKMAVARQLRNGIGFGSTEFHVLRPRDGVDAQYVYHFVSSTRFRAEAAHHMTGAVGQKRVPAAFLEQAEIPLPPVEEQRRIVAEMEKQFSRLDEAVTNVKRVKTKLKRYKTAVLKAAVEGRLVLTEAELARREGRSYETGSQLLQRILEARRSQWKGKGKYKEPAAPETTELPELPEGWVWASLDEIAWDSGYGTSQKCSYENAGPAVLRIPNVQNGSLDLRDLKFAPTAFEVAPSDEIKVGDMLVIRTNGSKSLIGRAAIVLANPARAISFASYLIRFRLVPMDTLPSWVSIVWQTAGSRSWIESRAATSAGQHNISMSVLATATVPIPPLTEQHRIVAEVDRRLSLVREVQDGVEINLVRASALRTQTLAQHFHKQMPIQEGSSG